MYDDDVYICHISLLDLMTIAYYIFSGLLIILNLLPLSANQHWMFRVWDFGRIQLLILEIIAILIGWAFLTSHNWFYYLIQSLLVVVAIQNIWLLIPFTPLYRVHRKKPSQHASKLLSVLSVNVYQFNTEYHLLIDLIKKCQPDMVLTLESNADWEEALRVLEKDFPHIHKETLENTYGMHFYSKIPIETARTDHFVSDDIPSFEIKLKAPNGSGFTFFGVHPPPPSPTEEETSKERDGDLMAVAKRVCELNTTTLVVGDFNNVAWARSSQLFRRTSGLIDPRRGYGLVSTFHAKYRLLRVPIDLLFHSSDIFIKEFKTLSAVGSDHFPMYCSFYIDSGNTVQERETETEEAGDKEEVEELIEKGKQEDGDRDAVASE